MAQGNYKEEIFKRLEKSGFTTVSQIVDWLAGDKPTIFDKKVKVTTQKERDRDSYTNFAEELAEPYQISEEVERAEATGEYDELKQLQIRASNLDRKFGTIRTGLIEEIGNRMKPIAKELEELEKAREKEAEEAEKQRIKEEREARGVQREVLRRASSDRRVRRNAQRRLSRLERRIANEISEGEEIIEEIE